MSRTDSLESQGLTPPETVFTDDAGMELLVSSQKNWATRDPWKLLAFFCSVMFLVWFDNGVFASNGVTGCSKDCPDPVGFPTAQGDFDLSKFQLGVLAAMFMFGLMIASVVLTQLTGMISPFRLVGVGMGIWMLAALGSAASQGFWSLLVARIFVGAGEASVITLSAPFVDDLAPKNSISLWFAILSSAPPLGVAVGYIFGGWAQIIGWRFCFVWEAALAIPVVAIAFFATDVPLRGANMASKSGEMLETDSSTASESKLKQFWADLRVLHQHPVYMLNTFAFAPIQAALGAFTFWGPKVASELYHLSSDAANLTLGGLTIVCALGGILGGGALLDYWGASIRVALALQLASSAVGLVFCSLAVGLIKETFWAFCLLFGVGLFGLFVATAPLYGVGCWSIPTEQRPIGQAYLVVIMHLLGDVPSPPVVGAIQGVVNNWHWSLMAVLFYLLLSVGLYGVGLAACRKAPDYRLVSEDVE